MRKIGKPRHRPDRRLTTHMKRCQKVDVLKKVSSTLPCPVWRMQPPQDDDTADLLARSGRTDRRTEAGCIRIFADKKSGENAEREELWRALGYLREDDTLVIPSPDGSAVPSGTSSRTCAARASAASASLAARGTDLAWALSVGWSSAPTPGRTALGGCGSDGKGATASQGPGPPGGCPRLSRPPEGARPGVRPRYDVTQTRTDPGTWPTRGRSHRRLGERAGDLRRPPHGARRVW